MEGEGDSGGGAKERDCSWLLLKRPTAELIMEPPLIPARKQLCIGVHIQQIPGSPCAVSFLCNSTARRGHAPMHAHGYGSLLWEVTEERK
ncbi:Serine/threonine-protein kinase MHK [Clarias magur]|uniref:Serine/threonine-protein kinase MHK n=1 Tax=Clarias magur TaxID=1594786 RepID=A0A8J4TDA6_CLAMG|nr:Serine/threonine-protein kinase MHK [Clarias magur]